MTDAELTAIWLTLKLATASTGILLLLGTALAVWLNSSRSWLRTPLAILVTLPLVLPPTVIGFYLLIAMGPNGPLGQLTQTLGIDSLAFSFGGLLLGSIIYSLPFVVYPIQNALAAVDRRTLDAAATLGAGPIDRFWTITLPLARRGFYTALLLGFVHTIGEFGVVLMIGGNIPGETQVLSILLYERVEAFDYASANRLAVLLIVFAFATLLLLQWLQHTPFASGRLKSASTSR